MSGLTLRSVRKNYGDVPVIKGVDLDIAHGEFVVFVGPSGCGKSTLLRMIVCFRSVPALPAVPMGVPYRPFTNACLLPLRSRASGCPNGGSLPAIHKRLFASAPFPRFRLSQWGFLTGHSQTLVCFRSVPALPAVPMGVPYRPFTNACLLPLRSRASGCPNGGSLPAIHKRLFASAPFPRFRLSQWGFLTGHSQTLVCFRSVPALPAVPMGVPYRPFTNACLLPLRSRASGCPNGGSLPAIHKRLFASAPFPRFRLSQWGFLTGHSQTLVCFRSVPALPAVPMGVPYRPFTNACLLPLRSRASGCPNGGSLPAIHKRLFASAPFPRFRLSQWGFLTGHSQTLVCFRSVPALPAVPMGVPYRPFTNACLLPLRSRASGCPNGGSLPAIHKRLSASAPFPRFRLSQWGFLTGHSQTLVCFRSVPALPAVPMGVPYRPFTNACLLPLRSRASGCPNGGSLPAIHKRLSASAPFPRFRLSQWGFLTGHSQTLVCFRSVPALPAVPMGVPYRPFTNACLLPLRSRASGCPNGGSLPAIHKRLSASAPFPRFRLSQWGFLTGHSQTLVCFRSVPALPAVPMGVPYRPFTNACLLPLRSRASGCPNGGSLPAIHKRLSASAPFPRFRLSQWGFLTGHSQTLVCFRSVPALPAVPMGVPYRPFTNACLLPLRSRASGCPNGGSLPAIHKRLSASAPFPRFRLSQWGFLTGHSQTLVCFRSVPALPAVPMGVPYRSFTNACLLPLRSRASGCPNGGSLPAIHKRLSASAPFPRFRLSQWACLAVVFPPHRVFFLCLYFFLPASPSKKKCVNSG